MDKKHNIKWIFSLAIVLFVLVIICIPSVISVVEGEDDDGWASSDNWTNGPSDSYEPTRMYGLDLGEYYALWGGDEDISMGDITDDGDISTDYGDEEIEVPEEGEIDGSNGEMSGENYFALYMTMDHMYRKPPKTAEIWNTGNNGALSGVLGNSGSSYYPNDVTVKSGSIIKDAYIDFYSIQPSTTLHYEGDDTQRYVSNDGEVLTALDYRVDKPDNDYGSTSKTLYSIHRKEIKNTRLLSQSNCVGGARCELATSNGGVSETLSYSGLKNKFGSLSGKMYLEGQIEVEIEERRYTRSNTSNPWRYQGNSFSTYTKHVKTSQQVSVQSLEGEVFMAIDNSSREPKTYYQIQTPEYTTDKYWSYLDINGKDKIRSNWRYYTERDKAWDKLTKSSESGTNKVHTKHSPVEVHAYPSKKGPRTFDENWGPTYYGEIHSVSETTNSKPNLNNNINVDLIDEQKYKTSNEIIASFSDGNSWPADDIKLYGLVQGENISITPDCCLEIKEVNLNIKDKEWDEETRKLTFTLKAVDENGNPVQTQGRPEKIVVNGTETYQTGPNGEVDVTFDAPRNKYSVSVSIETQEWWKLSDNENAYKNKERLVHYGGGFGGIINFVWIMIKIVIIILLPLWVLNFGMMLLGIDLWKIIKKIIKKQNPFN